MSFETVLVRALAYNLHARPVERRFYEPATDLLMASGLPVRSLGDRQRSNAVLGIYEALAAIDQRLLSPLEADEYKEIEKRTARTSSA